MPAKKKKVEPKKSKERKGIVIEEDISKRVSSAYLDYAMSVITSRALPDVRDGLKPVHRRVLFAMHGMGLNSSAKTRKAAAVVGDVLGKYHPHGNIPVYESMVRLAQDFKTRYPLIIGQGNFGSIDGDSPAAERYTEAKLAKISDEMLKDINKNTVTWRPNYENTRMEPEVLPSMTPNLLLNGGSGIAVGMATNIPPHNLAEVCEAALHLIDNEEATNSDLLKFIKGPDFPTGAIVYDKKAIAHAYSTGRGGVVVRGEIEVETSGKNNSIVISSIPYAVNKSDLLMKIGGLVQEKKMEGIRSLRDESADDIRVVLDLKSSANPQKIIHSLYKHTQMQSSFNYNMVVLVNGVPKTLSVRSILSEYVNHRRVVITRRTEFDLGKAKEREHILLGLKKALDHIDEIVKIIKSSKDVDLARASLIKKFKFTEAQTNAILDMKLQRLAGLERKKIDDELVELKKTIKRLETILASRAGVDGEIVKELKYLIQTYSDARRTKVVAGSVSAISIEDLEPEEDSVLVLTFDGYVKRTSPDAYTLQKRGGKGKKDLKTKAEDVVQISLHTSTHSNILFFTNHGKVYQLKMFEIPEGRLSTRGKSIANFLSLGTEEKVTSLLPISMESNEEMELVFVTALGIVKKVNLDQFKNIRKNGIIAMSLSKGDCLVDAVSVNKDENLLLVTSQGKGIQFSSNDLRSLGRGARGVKGITLSKDDRVVSALVVKKDEKGQSVVTLSANGYGKATDVEKYNVQNRGGSGVTAMSINEKSGDIVGAHMISDMGDFQVIAMSAKGQSIKMSAKDIPSRNRITLGVKIMSLKGDDSVATTVLYK